MAFDQKEVDTLLAETGRRCCICGTLHKVQVHHIIPRNKGGTDNIDNAIPLCPNCHDEVHSRFALGKTTRDYTADELKLHRERTKELVKQGKENEIGGKIEVSAKDGDKAIGLEINSETRIKPGTEVKVSTERVRESIGVKIGKRENGS